MRPAAPVLPLLVSRFWPAAEPLRAPVWVHGVSVGEVELATLLVAALKERRPSLGFLVTATTPAGVGLLARRFRAGEVLATRPFPLDLPFSVKRFFRATAPRLLVLVETELWPGVLLEARKRRVPVLLVNARLSARSTRRYRALRRLLAGPLSAVTRVAARSAEDAARFGEIGIPKERIFVAGDMKFDRPEAPEPTFAGIFRQLRGSRPVLVAGSIADEELSLVLEVRKRIVAEGQPVFLLLAPRRPESFEEVADRLSAAGLTVARRSRAFAGSRPDVFLLDTLGELAGAYRLGDVALLGGTFGTRGGHNVLEPLRASLPTLHGPSTWNIAHALEGAAGAVRLVADAGEAAREAAAFLGDPMARGRAAEAATSLFARHAGATAAAAEAALALLDAEAPAA